MKKFYIMFFKVLFLLLIVLTTFTINSKVNAQMELIEFKVNTASSNLNLRKSPKSNATIIEKLQKNNSVYTTITNLKNTVRANGIEWIKVISKNGNQGYVAKKYLSEKTITLKINTTSKTPLNLRKFPGTSSKIVDTIPYNSYVTTTTTKLNRLSKMNGYEWVQVTSPKGTTGYVAKKYLSEESLKLKVYSNGNLNLRESPNTNASILERIPNGSFVYTTESNKNKIINANGYQWIYITTANGKQGFVAKKYLKQVNIENDNRFNSYRTQFGSEGTVEGYLGIDVAPGLSCNDVAVFESIINGTTKISKKAIGIEFRPSFVYLKFGATGYGTGDMKIIDDKNTYPYLKEFVRLCEEYEIPYGGYYFSQSINISEANAEVDQIKSVFKRLEKDLGYELEYNILPFAIDIEEGHTERGRTLSGINRNTFNKAKYHLITEVEKLAQVKSTIIYTNVNMLRDKYLKLEPNQKLWIVDPIEYPIHSQRIVKGGYTKHIDNRQIKLDYTINGVTIDINLMNKTVYEDLT